MLSRRVLATPLAQLERVGIPRILVTLTEDVAMIGWAAQNIPSYAMNIAGTRWLCDLPRLALMADSDRGHCVSRDRLHRI